MSIPKRIIYPVAFDVRDFPIGVLFVEVVEGNNLDVFQRLEIMLDCFDAMPAINESEIGGNFIYSQGMPRITLGELKAESWIELLELFKTLRDPL